MRKIIASSLIGVFIITGCAGRPAIPVMVDQVGDNRKSCAAIETEMKGVQAEIQRLLPESDKTGKNVGLGIAGAFLLVPLFFMDLTESEKIEINSYRQRYNRLGIIAAEKKCSFADVSTENENPTTATQSSVAKKLEELNALFKQGLINQNEYQVKRQEILKAM